MAPADRNGIAVCKSRARRRLCLLRAPGTLALQELGDCQTVGNRATRRLKRAQEQVLLRGPREGHCVLCGVFGKLTRDHVPPRGCGNASDMVLRTLVDVAGPDACGPAAISQGGAHFRTICETCNTRLLGAEYDPELAKMCTVVSGCARAAYESRLILPENVLVWVRPQRAARAVVGHALAANAVREVIQPPVDAPFPDALRQYFLDPAKPLPEKVDIYFWVYPSRRQVIVKGAAKASLASLARGRFLLGDIIKFFPFGFWILWDKPKLARIPHPLLVPDRSMGIDDAVQMTISLRRIPPPGFPEHPADDEMMLLSDDSTSVGEVRNRV